MRYDEEDEDEGPKADPTLEQGMPLPIRLNAVFPPELTAVPIEDIDPYYRNQRVSSLCVYLQFCTLHIRGFFIGRTILNGPLSTLH